jgi:hypothetical protein
LRVIPDIKKGISLEKQTLDQFYGQAINLLEELEFPYVIIGGLAVSLIGEPRMTQDIDFILSIPEKEIHHFLDTAINRGFSLNMKKELQRVKQTGTFRFSMGLFYADVILASSEFESSVFKRRKRIKLAGKKAYFPTPEDLIILKIVAGREKDMLDAKSILIRHQGKLDQKYMEKWVQRISDEAQDMSVWNRLLKLSTETGS